MVRCIFFSNCYWIFFVSIFCFQLVDAQVLKNPTDLPDSNKITSPILLISKDQILKKSNVGKALLTEYLKRQELLVTEARVIEDKYIAEEQNLTQIRTEIDISDFQKLADDFDSRAEAERARRLTKDKELRTKYENWKRQFFLIGITPILKDLMLELGADIIIYKNQALIYNNQIEITRRVISKLDARYNEKHEIIKEIIKRQ